MLLAAIIGTAGFKWMASLKPSLRQRDLVARTYNVEVFDVERADLIEVISGFGTAHADREVVLAAQVSGEVIGVHRHLEVGLVVRPPGDSTTQVGSSGYTEGDLLVRIDPSGYRERVEQARNRLDETSAEIALLVQQEKNNQRRLEKARADLETVRLDHDRVRNARKRGAASATEVTRSILELKKYEDTILQYETQTSVLPLQRAQAEQRLETQRADLRLAELDLEHTHVQPPFRGTISRLTVEKGQFVRPGDPLLRLMDRARIEIPVALALDDFFKLQARLEAGRPIPVELAETETAAPRWRGRVVRSSPQADPATRTVNVFVEVDNTGLEAPLLPGTFVQARIDGPVLERAIAIPRDAIVSGRAFVVNADRTAESREVDVDRTLQSLAVISAGLNEGDRVIVTNLDIISDRTVTRVGNTDDSISDQTAGTTTDSAAETWQHRPKVAIRGRRRLSDELDGPSYGIARRPMTAECAHDPNEIQ